MVSVDSSAFCMVSLPGRGVDLGRQGGALKHLQGDGKLVLALLARAAGGRGVGQKLLFAHHRPSRHADVTVI